MGVEESRLTGEGIREFLRDELLDSLLRLLQDSLRRYSDMGVSETDLMPEIPPVLE